VRRIVPALAAVALLSAACRSAPQAVAPTSAPPGTSIPTAGAVTPISPPPAPSPSGLPFVRVRLRMVATLEQPVAMATRGGGSSLFFAEKTGRVVAVRDGRVSGTVLDLSGDVSNGGEQGLLGLAFSPDGRYLYVDYTDRDGDTHVTEFAFDGGVASLGSRRDVLFVPQPYSNHNGGQIAFGPDGDLYIGLGDGGSEGDPQNRGQSLRTPLGKILRIEPRPQGSRPYGIPNDNPFVGRAGARPEIWAYGLRNPWRFSFDRETGDLWIGDVGQNEWEEVDFQPGGSPGGQNYGWRLREGTHEFKGPPPPSSVDPIYEYSHDGGGCVVTGGYVYRGRAIPALVGAYVFADFCIGRITALVERGGRVASSRALPARVSSLDSFGHDNGGELYALSLDGPVYRLAPG
jgi:glucose/arabinose dehydrogenase